MQQDGWEAIFCSSKACPSHSPFLPAAQAIGGETIPTASGTFISSPVEIAACEESVPGPSFPEDASPVTVSGGAHPSSFSPPAYQQHSHLLQASGRNRSKHLKTDVCADDCSSLTSISLLQPPNGASVLTSPINCPCQGPNHLTLPCTGALPGFPAPNTATSPFLNCSLLTAFSTPVSLLLEAVPSQSPFLLPLPVGPACLHPHSLK